MRLGELAISTPRTTVWNGTESMAAPSSKKAGVGMEFKSQRTGRTEGRRRRTKGKKGIPEVGITERVPIERI